jgi:hypothetical protein
MLLALGPELNAAEITDQNAPSTRTSFPATHVEIRRFRNDVDPIGYKRQLIFARIEAA